MIDDFDLERFVKAQDAYGVYTTAVEELRRAHKTSHWMWFVFPQIAGLGQSQMSQTFAISSLGEARAYRQHLVLGPRLIECAQLLLSHESLTAVQIFGAVDAQKLQSSTTLFLRADPHDTVFQRLLDRYFDGRPDKQTDARL